MERGHEISNLADTQNLTEQGPEQPDRTSALALC